jgi:GTP 3',8-cyclase
MSVTTALGIKTGDGLRDSFGRQINNLRISVTDRCNFRCRYCMPEQGMAWMAKSELLSYEEIARLTRIFAELGIKKIRLTGGEPLMRKELPKLVAEISAVRGIEDLALTTNGYFLPELAGDLVRAGLRRINVSLDSLEPGRFEEVTRRNYFDKVWKGIEAIETLGIRPIKLNVVLIRGVNDGEIGAFARLARSKPFVIRFIEFMPIGSDDGWSTDKVVPTAEVVQRLEQELGSRLVEVEKHGNQPADRYRPAEGEGEFGFISSVSEPFCEHCNRIRITSDGKLRTCLFSLEETDLRSMLRSGAVDEEIKNMIQDSVQRKEEGHLINQPGFVRPTRTMSQIGG